MAEAQPLTIRLGEHLPRIEAHMARTGLKLRAAVIDLIRSGLQAEEEGAGPPPPRRHNPKAVLEAAQRRAGVEPVTLIKPNPKATTATNSISPAVRAKPKLDTSMVQVGPGAKSLRLDVEGPQDHEGAPRG